MTGKEHDCHAGSGLLVGHAVTLITHQGKSFPLNEPQGSDVLLWGGVGSGGGGGGGGG